MKYENVKKLVYIIIILLVSSTSSLFSQISRIEGMGKLFLIIADEDNNLNMYDRGKNSAYLINDELKDWLKINLSSAASNGSFHRLYDPSGVNFYDIHFEALKIIDENQTFKGIIDYYDHKRKDVYKAIQTNVYGTQPFLIQDSTTGTLSFYGPRIGFEYSLSVLKDLSLGFNFSYGGEKGIKKIYTKPEITNRYVSGQISLAYNINENFALGAKFDPFYNYEKIELAKDPDTGTDPITFKYRGTKIFRKSSDDYTRHNKNKGFNLEIQSNYSDSSLHIYFSTGYFRQAIDCIDGTREIDKEGYWQEDGFTGSLITRFEPDFIDKNLSLGFGITYKKLSSWSKHPLLPIIFSENKFNNIELMAGVSYNFTDLGLVIGTEYHKTLSDTTLNDYLGNYQFDSKNPREDIRFGAEQKLSNNLWIRAGFIHFAYNPDNVPSEIKYKQNLYTFGASYLIENFVKIDLQMNYGKKESKEYSPNLTYKETNIMLFAKFFVF